MLIALIGYGNMGQAIDALVSKTGHKIVARIDPHHPVANARSISEKALNEADVCIDFTRPDKVIQNAQAVAELGRHLVIGTTGWMEQINELSKIVEATNIGVIYAPNFSVGIALFLRIAAHAASLIDKFDEYDVAGVESHHRQKIDVPSGTALAIQKALMKAMPQRGHLIEEFRGIRCGNIPGTHTVMFDSESDTIELTHCARNRNGFAHGALKAAEWIHGRQGLYTLEDYLQQILKEKTS